MPQTYVNNPVLNPIKGSIEQITESAGGWQPGMRKVFDQAMMRGDVQTVKKLLPQIPTEYKQRFIKEIINLLGKTTLGGTPTVF
jgi:hypothetical protein